MTSQPIYLDVRDKIDKDFKDILSYLPSSSIKFLTYNDLKNILEKYYIKHPKWKKFWTNKEYHISNQSIKYFKAKIKYTLKEDGEKYVTRSL